MLTCAEVTELVTSYLEGQMAWRRRMAFRLHLGMCKHCRAYLRQMKSTVKVLGRVPADPIPPELRDDLARRLAAMRKKDG
jgi:predicted anti-sigma-YlaC factor YlaD